MHHSILNILVPAYDMVWNIIKYPKLLNKKSFIAEIFYRYLALTFFFSWLFSLIPYIGSLLNILLMLYAGYLIYSQSNSKTKFSNTLYYFIILFIGFLGMRSFIGHTLLRDTVAKSIGWEVGSPFQIELAFYHLGLSISAFIYIWRSSLDLAIGLVISKSIFLLGAMAIHIFEFIKYQNTNTGNFGVGIIFGDLVLPIILLWLLWRSLEERRIYAKT